MKLFSYLALVFVTTMSAIAQDTVSVESKIIAIEKAWNQAHKFRDKKALSDILHDSMALVNDDGSLQSKASFLRVLMRRSHPTSNKPSRSRSPCMYSVTLPSPPEFSGKRALKTARLTSDEIDLSIPG